MAVIAVIVIAIAALLIFYRDYVKAFVYSRKYSGTDISDMLSENDDELTDVLKEYPGVRAPTQDELSKLENGDITQDELVKEIVGEVVGVQDSETTDNQQTTVQKPTVQTPDQTQTKDYDKQITEQITKMYVLKSYYIGQLDGIESSVKSDYEALADSEKNATNKKNIIMKYYSKGISLESECDGKVEKILSELSALLDEAGRDKAIVSSIREAYNKEKTLKKAYYMNIYTN